MLGQFIGHGRPREPGAAPESLNRGFTKSRRNNEDSSSAGDGRVESRGDGLHGGGLILTFATVSDTLFAVSFTCLRSLSCVDSVGFRG